jgi:hypothetical protein
MTVIRRRSAETQGSCGGSDFVAEKATATGWAWPANATIDLRDVGVVAVGDRRRLLAAAFVAKVASFFHDHPNKASSRDGRTPDLRATVAATTLQSRVISSLLASSAHLRAIE